MKVENAAQLSRQQVRVIGLGATTQTEVKQARQMLEEWQAAHPCEPMMFDIFEQLYILEDARRSFDAEPAA